MAREATAASKILHAPMLLEWTKERLSMLEQEQLLTLLANLDHQRVIGRISEVTATALDERITALLTKQNGARRRSDLAKAAGAASEVPTRPRQRVPGVRTAS